MSVALNGGSPTSTDRSTIKIGILGGGPAGLMTALSLEAYIPSGIEIVLLDRNASETDYPGVEYGIQERACRALERIGLLGAAMMRAVPCTEIAFSNSRLSRKYASIRPDPHYTRCVVRQEFLADLARLLRRTDVRRRHLVKAVKPQPNGSVTVEGEFDGRDFHDDFDLLIAADGVHSVVRRTFFPETAAPQDRGFSAIYMLVEGTEDTAPRPFLDRANSGRSELIMGSLATLAMFPLGRGRLSFSVGFDHAVKERVWREAGLEPGTEWSEIPAATKFAIARRLTEDAGDATLVEALDLVPDWDSYKIYLWAMRDTDALGKPYVDDANILLLGDSAHAIMPTIGMGASLAMEDAELFARQLRDAWSAISSDDPSQMPRVLEEDVFAPFAKARVPVWQDLVGRSRRAATRNFVDVAKRKRFAIGPQIPRPVLSKVVTEAETILDRFGI